MPADRTLHAIKQIAGQRSDALKQQLTFVKNANTIKEIQRILCYYITKNRKFHNNEVFKSEQYERTAPVHLDQLKYVDNFLQVNQVCKIFGFEQDNLSKNKLLLEKIMLEKLLRKEQQEQQHLNTELPPFTNVRLSSHQFN